MDLQKIVTSNLEKYRKEKDFSQKDVAKKIGISPSHYSRLELWRVEPALSTLVKVSEALDIQLWQLFVPLDITELPLSEKFKKIKDLPREDQVVIHRIINMALEREDMKKELY
jgi:transcriptional regulator with XRE-family HTH domain